MEPKAPPPAATDDELDEALARVIRQLIAEAIEAGTPEVGAAAA